MKKKTLAERVLEITDAHGGHLAATAIHERMTEPKPTLECLRAICQIMARRYQLDRRKTTNEIGQRGPPFYEYKSGAVPVTPSPGGRKKRLEQRANLGFQALARLEREQPDEWARLTEGGTR